MALEIQPSKATTTNQPSVAKPVSNGFDNSELSSGYGLRLLFGTATHYKLTGGIHPYGFSRTTITPALYVSQIFCVLNYTKHNWHDDISSQICIETVSIVAVFFQLIQIIRLKCRVQNQRP